NGTWNRYYHCRNHDPIKAGGDDRRCPERNIRSDALDTFVFDQVRAALLRPDVLTAGEQALAVRTPTPDDELLAAELARLDRRLDATDAERRRLVDLSMPHAVTTGNAIPRKPLQRDVFVSATPGRAPRPALGSVCYGCVPDRLS